MGKHRNKKNKRQQYTQESMQKLLQQVVVHSNKILVHDAKWIALYKTAGGFTYAERRGRDSVGILLTRNNGTEVLLRCQPLCADYSHYYGCPVTGSIDHDGESIDACAIREVLEETGYVIREVELLTKYITGTQTNEQVYIYTADVTGITPGKDMNEEMGEAGENVWIPLEMMLECRYSGTLIGYTFLKARCAA